MAYDGEQGDKVAQDISDSDAPGGQPVPRQSPRVETMAEVTLRHPGHGKYRVRLFDLSPEGARIELVEQIAVGELAWVRFDGLAAIGARICWVESHVAGIRFETPLHSAIFEQVRDRCKPSG